MSSLLLAALIACRARAAVEGDVIAGEPPGARVLTACGFEGVTPLRVNLGGVGCEIQLRLPGYLTRTEMITGSVTIPLEPTPDSARVKACHDALVAALPDGNWSYGATKYGDATAVTWNGPVDIWLWVEHPGRDTPWRRSTWLDTFGGREPEWRRTLGGHEVSFRLFREKRRLVPAVRAVFDQCLR